MKPPRIVQLLDPHERELLMQEVGKPGTPELYHSFRDNTAWADESQLYKWRQQRERERK